MSREAMKQALEALELYQSKSSVQMFDDAVRALRQALAIEAAIGLAHAFEGLGKDRKAQKALEAEQPAQQQEPVDSAEKAATYLDARLWEFIDMAAAWPEAKPDPRIWGHVMVYAPKQPSKPWVGLTDEELAEIDGVVMKYIGTGEYVIEGEYEFARAIETKLREKNI